MHFSSGPNLGLNLDYFIVNLTFPSRPNHAGFIIRALLYGAYHPGLTFKAGPEFWAYFNFGKNALAKM